MVKRGFDARAARYAALLSADLARPLSQPARVNNETSERVNDFETPFLRNLRSELLKLDAVRLDKLANRVSAVTELRPHCQGMSLEGRARRGLCNL